MAGFNATIESYIGAPVDIYRPAEDADRIHEGVFGMVRPWIHTIYSAINTRQRPYITAIMSLMYNYEAVRLLPVAANAGLVPPVHYQPGGLLKPANVWVDEYYELVFGAGAPQDQQLSLVVQGGEAVNFYTTYRDGNVPTHDMDTRILVGEHFNYLRDVADVDDAAQRRMHIYRFFVVYATAININVNLARIRQHFINPVAAEALPAIQYAHTHLPGLTTEDIVAANVTCVIGDILLDQALIAGYQLTNDNIMQLMCVNVVLRGTYYGVVDLGVPFRRPGQAGHSDNIHTYFDSPQAMNTTLQGNRSPLDPSNPGCVPHLDFVINAPPGIIGMSAQVTVRMVPHGYLLWDTIRMLLASHLAGLPKTMKYKQKLACIMATLARGDMSQPIFDICNNNKTRNLLKTNLMLGGARQPAMNELSTQPAKVSSQMDLSNAPLKTVALEFSRTLLAGDTSLLADKSQWTEDQWDGYMDYLSFQDPQWSEFRLPRPAEPSSYAMKTPSMDDIDRLKVVLDEMSVTQEGSARRTNRRKTYRNKRAGQKLIGH